MRSFALLLSLLLLFLANPFTIPAPPLFASTLPATAATTAMRANTHPPRSKKPYKRVISTNKQAYRNYEILDKLEVGLSLQSSEIKAARNNNVQLSDAFLRIDGNAGHLHNAHFAKYEFASSRDNHEEKRIRRVLMHKNEARKLGAACAQQGMTVVALSLYFNEDNRLKLLVGLAKGKNFKDKRVDIKARDTKRDTAREMKGSW